MLPVGIIITGFMLDLWLGDPEGRWHPVCGIGQLISALEKRLRSWFPAGKKGELAGGILLVTLVLLVTGAISVGLVTLASWIHPVLGFVVNSLICYQMLAVKSLKDASMKVYERLAAGDLEGARHAVSMIVGRDTKDLTEEGITKAAVETVAENTSDGVIAPLFYMALGGAVGVCLYKAVNTMDSMIGYKNDRYLYFGRAAARLDDVCNWIPARLSAILMIAAAWWSRLDYRRAFRICKRDRYQHKSPNSAHTEAVCAGALGVQLAGDAWYFGTLHHKPFIGDPVRSIQYEDIRRANQLLYGTAVLAVALEVVIWLCINMAGIFMAGRSIWIIPPM